MPWKSITPDEVKGLKFARGNNQENKWAGAIEAALKGPVRIDVEPDSNIQSLKWSLSRAIKKAGDTVQMSTLADKTAVILTKKDAPSK